MKSRASGMQRTAGILRSVLNMEDRAFRGTPGQEEPSRIMLSGRIVPRAPLRIIEAGLNVD